MKDIRICPYCKKAIDCSIAGYRSLNGHVSGCFLNPKSIDRKKKLKKKKKKQHKLTCKCGTVFVIEATHLQFERGNYKKFCSRSCANSRVWNDEINRKRSQACKNNFRLGDRKSRKGVRLKPVVHKTCLGCGRLIEGTIKEVSKRKYCSGTCRNLTNNKHIRGLRSKGEIKLEESLRDEFQEYTIITNNRKVLDGMELDIYIPDIKLGIEWNGIFHYVDVHGNLKDIVKRDEKKLLLAEHKGIDLYVVRDITSSEKEIMDNIRQVIYYIHKKYHAP